MAASKRVELLATMTPEQHAALEQEHKQQRTKTIKAQAKLQGAIEELGTLVEMVLEEEKRLHELAFQFEPDLPTLRASAVIRQYLRRMLHPHLGRHIGDYLTPSERLDYMQQICGLPDACALDNGAFVRGEFPW